MKSDEINAPDAARTMTTDYEQQRPQRSDRKAAAGYFLLVLLGSLLSAGIGAAFGALVAMVSPEFVKSLFSLKPEHGSVFRYASSVGMIWGLFIGVGVSCFACLLRAF